MDQNLLVRSGHALIAALDAAGIPPRSALWVHNTDTDTWKLWLVPPKGNEDKMELYRRISELVSRNRVELSGIDAGDTEIVSDSHPAISGISEFIKFEKLDNISFPGNKFNNYYLPESIILRSNV